MHKISLSYSVFLTERVKIVDIACGNTHTVAVTDRGEVWTWGLGSQLGLNCSEIVNTPRRMDFLSGRKVHFVPSNCIILKPYALN